jgi:hypothetical protein
MMIAALLFVLGIIDLKTLAGIEALLLPLGLAALRAGVKTNEFYSVLGRMVAGAVGVFGKSGPSVIHFAGGPESIPQIDGFAVKGPSADNPAQLPTDEDYPT